MVRAQIAKRPNSESRDEITTLTQVGNQAYIYRHLSALYTPKIGEDTYDESVACIDAPTGV